MKKNIKIYGIIKQLSAIQLTQFDLSVYIHLAHDRQFSQFITDGGIWLALVSNFQLSILISCWLVAYYGF